MNSTKQIACIWCQTSSGARDNAGLLLDVITEHLTAMGPHMQARNKELYQRASPQMPLLAGNKTSTSSRSPREESVARKVDWERSRYVRVCCPLRGQGWAFDREAWSISFWCDDDNPTSTNNLLIVFDVSLLTPGMDTLVQFMPLIEPICTYAEVLTGVCDVGPWDDTIGGMYYTREHWFGFPNWRRLRRQMWMNGLSTRGLVRDIGWLTIVGDRIHSNIPAWESICREFELPSDGLTSVRQQQVLHTKCAVVFAVSNSLRTYLSEQLDECSCLNGWLAARLRDAGALM